MIERQVEHLRHKPTGLNTSSWQRVVVIYAHPDDETVMGGTIAKLCREGKKVTLVVTTNGNLGVNVLQQHPPTKLAQIRQAEQIAAANLLGAREVVFLDYPDQGLATATTELTTKLTAIIKTVHPQAIFTWYPNSPYFSHPDHVITAETTVRAMESITFNPKRPELYLFAPPPALVTHYSPIASFADLKMQALATHATQYTEAIRVGFANLMTDEWQVTNGLVETFNRYV